MPQGILAKWAFYFKDLPENRYPGILRQILADEKEIRMAEQGRIKFSLREKFLYAYRSYQRAKLDETSSRIYLREKALREGRNEGIELGIEQGREQGLRQGLEQGREQGIEQGIFLEKKRVARMMKEQQIGVDVIAATTGLGVDEIETL